MRNLKRVLSLALALVMVLGMMVITTSAATYTDAEEITYTEAVDVVSAIGVINGFPAADGTFTFDADGLLTREQGAKILTYLLLGKDIADKLVGSGNFSDVAANRWSAGCIDYCASLGILVGGGNGTFDPTGPLTGVQFGKMLLCALGYDAKVERYEGKDWAVNITIDMMDAGLTNDEIALDKQLTREAAAQMTFQALTSTMVKYATKGTSITVGGVEITSGASEAEYVAQGNYASYASVATEGLQLCEKYAPALKLGNGTGDDFGRPASHKWYLEKDRVAGFNPLKDVAVANIMIPAAVKYEVTGVRDTSLALIAKKLDLKVADGVSASAVKGDTVELYVDYTGTIFDAVVLHTELAQIVKVVKPTGEDVKYNYDVFVKCATGPVINYTDKTLVGFDFDTMTKDTYITLVKGNNTAIAAVAESFTGKQTAKGNGYIKVDGAQKSYAGDVWTVDAVNYTDTFNFYVDAKGLIIGTEKVAAAKVAYDIFFVADGNFVKGNSWTPSVAKLAVINLDGTQEVLDMAITVKAGVKYVNKTVALENTTAFAPGFYAYTLTEDGKVATLVSVDDSSIKNTAQLIADGNYVDFDKEKAEVKVNSSSNKMLATTTTEVVFIDLVTGATESFNGYLEFTNEKFTVAADGALGILYTTNKGYLETIYVLGATVSTSDTYSGWFVKAGDEFEIPGVPATFQEVVYFVDDEEVTFVTVKADSYPTAAYIVVTDGLASLSNDRYTTHNAVVEKVTDTYLVLGGQVVYFSDKGVSYYDVTNVAKNGIVVDDAVSVGDVISYTTYYDYITDVYTTYHVQEDGVLTTYNSAYLTGHANFAYDIQDTRDRFAAGQVSLVQYTATTNASGMRYVLAHESNPEWSSDTTFDGYPRVAGEVYIMTTNFDYVSWGEGTYSYTIYGTDGEVYGTGTIYYAG